jgi:hypothetical protein
MASRAPLGEACVSNGLVLHSRWMSDEVHLWRIDPGDQLAKIERGRLDLESRLQEWMAQDISVLDPALLVIDREVETDFGGFIDILCIDEAGDLTIVELKRDKTPREITAQALDYASWVVGLSNERVRSIADVHHRGEFENAFRTKFGVEIPETLNGDHRIVVVGSEIDASSERIIRYLSDTHGVNINAATFQFFNDTGRELLARVFLIEPSEVALSTRTKGTSKRKPNLTYDELKALAVEAGVEELYVYAVSTFEQLLGKHRTQSSVVFEETLTGSKRALISLRPGFSNATDGLDYELYKYRYAALAKLPLQEVERAMPTRHEDWSYGAPGDPDIEGYRGFIKSPDEIDRIAQPLREASRTARETTPEPSHSELPPPSQDTAATS